MAYKPKDEKPKAKKNNKLKKLTESQKNMLKRHGNHHSNKHVAMMRMSMMRGKSFNAAHMEAKKKVGK